jgi:hypothetical protein
LGAGVRTDGGIRHFAALRVAHMIGLGCPFAADD